MARFVARVHNLTDNQPELVEIEAASVGDALRILADEGFGTLDLMTAEDASAKGLKGRLIGAVPVARIPQTAIERSPVPTGRATAYPLAVLVEFVGVPVLAAVVIPVLNLSGRPRFRWENEAPDPTPLALALLAVVTLSPLWLRPASTAALTGQQRFGLWALIGFAGLAWWLWTSMGEPSKFSTSIAMLTILGLVTVATYLRIGWSAKRSPARSSTTH